MNLITRAIQWLRGNEPLAAVNAVAAAVFGVVVQVRAFVEDAQAGLEGEHAWLAVGWAALVLGSRHFVSPKERVGSG